MTQKYGKFCLIPRCLPAWVEDSYNQTAIQNGHGSLYIPAWENMIDTCINTYHSNVDIRNEIQDAIQLATSKLTANGVSEQKINEAMQCFYNSMNKIGI